MPLTARVLTSFRQVPGVADLGAHRREGDAREEADLGAPRGEGDVERVRVRAQKLRDEESESTRS